MKAPALRWLFLVLTAATLRGSLDDIPGYKQQRVHRELAEVGARGAWWVRAEWMAVSVPVADALRLVPALRERKTTARTVEEISALVAAGKATLHGQPVLSVRAGGRGGGRSRSRRSGFQRKMILGRFRKTSQAISQPTCQWRSRFRRIQAWIRRRHLRRWMSV